jgi:predicted TIM-barrel fold metal-dependent hydrolase
MFIDIHVHTRSMPGPDRWGKQAYATPEQLIARYDEIGVEKGVLLPGVSPECAFAPQSNEDILGVCEKWTDRFIPFCNVDPRAMTNSVDAPLDHILGFYKKRGCKGVGEITANLPLNHPMVHNLFKHCEKLGMPVVFHLAPALGGNYGLYDDPGLPLLEYALGKFPELIFLGHSQVFWAEIAPLDTVGTRAGYPKGPITKEGAVPKLMRKYSNLHGDLSARSGSNAVSRDPEFGCEFLEEFQDRLYFGTDICAPDTPTPLVGFLKEMSNKERISQECFNKVSRENAVKLLGLSK